MPSSIVLTGYAIDFFCLTLILRTIPVGIAHAVWTSLGIVLIAIVGAILSRQAPDGLAILGMALVISGVVTSHLFSKSIEH